MRLIFIYLRRRLTLMPFALHAFTLLCTSVPIFGLGFYIQGDPGVPLSKVLLIAAGSVVVIYGFLQATRWSRPLLMLYLVAGSIWAIFRHHATYSFLDYLGLLAPNGFFLWILYFKRDVREYYVKAAPTVES
jgi:hypothetical protein